MLNWLNRVRAARMERFATRLRRRHAILQRPPTGQLILETLGISRRRLTLLNWTPRAERGTAPLAGRRFVGPAPADPKNIRPSWPVTKPAATDIPTSLDTAEPVPAPPIGADRWETTVGDAEAAAEALADAAVDSPSPAIAGEAPTPSPEPAELTAPGPAESAAPEPIEPAPPSAVRASPAPGLVPSAPEPPENAPIRSVPAAGHGPRHPDLPNVEPTAAAPAEALQPMVAGPAPEPAAAEARPAVAAELTEPFRSETPVPVAPIPDVQPTPSMLPAPSAEVAAIEAGPGGEVPVTRTVEVVETPAGEVPRTASVDPAPRAAEAHVTPPVSLVVPPFTTPQTQAGHPEPGHEPSPPVPAELVGAPAAAAPSLPPSEPAARPESDWAASEPLAEPPLPVTTSGLEPIVAQPMAGEPVVAEPMAAELMVGGEPTPSVVARQEPPPTETPSESRPPSWTPVETRHARPPARRRESSPHPSAPEVTRSQTPEPAAESSDPFGQPKGLAEPVAPLEWLARLRRAHGPKPGPDAPAKAEPPVRAPSQGQPISIANRELLEPMIGIDLGSVRVHQGAEAAQATGALGADALAVGEQIVLGAGHQDSDRKTVGLLGHELLHVARQRIPRFVPPILRGMPRAAELGRPPFRPSARPPSPRVPDQRAPGVTHAAEEEAMALVVEAAAIAASRDRARSVTRGPGPPAPLPAAEGPDTHESPIPGLTPADPEAPPPWGTLPAPWEPLPDLLTNRSEAGAEGPAAPSANAGQWPVTTTPPIQAAGAGRQVPDQPTPEPKGPATPGGPAPKADLDALAKQVYTVLKRRLAGERRRAQ